VDSGFPKSIPGSLDFLKDVTFFNASDYWRDWFRERDKKWR
jgi:hypothetical protein